MKNRWWKRMLAPGVIAAAVLGSMAGCKESLSEEFQEEEVIQAAEEMVERLNEGELEDVYQDTFNVVMQNGVEPEELQENLDYLMKDKGEFQEFEKIQIRGIKDKDTGTSYATALVLAAYEEGKIMFTISFDTDMKCAGFYMK